MASAQIWHPVALTGDVPPGMVTPASLPFGPIAVWRGHSGRIAANHDRCPHRGMRLSHGFVRQDQLSCIYHGWRFAQDGRCVGIPAHPRLTPPETIHCGALPTREAHGIIWVSAEPTEELPVAPEGFAGLRWLDVACTRETLASVAGGSESARLKQSLAGTDTYLVQSETETGHLRLFLLAPEGLETGACLALSQAFERLRERLEQAHLDTLQTSHVEAAQ